MITPAGETPALPGRLYFRNSLSRALGAPPMAHEKVFFLGPRASRPQNLTETDSFPTQMRIRRFPGFLSTERFLITPAGEDARAPRASLFSEQPLMRPGGAPMAHEKVFSWDRGRLARRT